MNSLESCANNYNLNQNENGIHNAHVMSNLIFHIEWSSF